MMATTTPPSFDFDAGRFVEAGRLTRLEAAFAAFYAVWKRSYSKGALLQILASQGPAAFVAATARSIWYKVKLYQIARDVGLSQLLRGRSVAELYGFGSRWRVVGRPFAEALVELDDEALCAAEADVLPDYRRRGFLPIARHVRDELLRAAQEYVEGTAFQNSLPADVPSSRRVSSGLYAST